MAYISRNQARSSDLLAPYLGDSEANLRELFSRATALGCRTPCVLLLQDIDAICPKRSARGDGDSHGARMGAQLLVLLDGMRSRGRVCI